MWYLPYRLVMAFSASARCGSRHHGGGGGGVPAFFPSFVCFVFLLVVAAVPSSATTEAQIRVDVPSSATTEAQLRAAVLSSTPRVLVVNSDILLTSDLPEVVCPDLTIRGTCRGRLCKIDGRGRYRGFFQPGKITVSRIELTRMSSNTSIGSTIWGENSASTVVLRNVVISYASNRRAVRVFEGEIKASDTVFYRNSAGAIAVTDFTTLEGTNLRFISNKADIGAAILNYESVMNCTNCRFEGNEAQFGGAVNMNDNDNTEASFFKCHFGRNRATERGGGGGAVFIASVEYQRPVRFCRCSFVSNTGKTTSGATVTDHVLITTNDDAVRIHFCPKRPRTGVTIRNPDMAPYVIDTCSSCG